MDLPIATFLLQGVLIVLFIMAANVIIHELGHAIPSLIFTDTQVTVFIGSFGNKGKSFKVKIARLEMWFRYNPLLWRKGVCQFSPANVPLTKQMIIIGSGPFISLILAVAAITFFKFSNNPQARAISLPFIYYALMFFACTIIPIDKKLAITNGYILYNDGYKLMMMFRLKRYSGEQQRAINYYNEKKYIKAGEIFEFLLKKKVMYKAFFTNAVNSYLFGRDYHKVLDIDKNFSAKFILNSNEFCSIGVAKLINKMYPQAKADFEKSLALNPNNLDTLNNIAYNYILTKEYEKGIPYLDKAIAIDAKFSHGYTDRGLAKVKLGKTVDGFNDLTKAIELDTSNAHAYRNVGIYYHDIGNYAKALSFYNKALELDAHTHLINELIKETENCLLNQKGTN